MAFFLVRSALCIGAVAVAASGLGPFTRALPALPRDARGALERAGRACLASPACLRAASAAGDPGIGRAVAGSVEDGDRPPPAPPGTDAAHRAPARGGVRAPPAPRA